MLSVVCFSKDRPLQLQAYLESLLYYSGIKEEYITILYKKSNQIEYDELFVKYPKVRWKEEISFNEDIITIINEAENFIFFGCDDVIFKSYFDLNYCMKSLQLNQNLYAFSLRLGTNITGVPSLSVNNHHFEWEWKGLSNPSWNYPWEVSGSVYRKSDVVKYMQKVGTIINPNYFEDLFYKYILINGKANPDFNIPGCLACFEKSKCMTLTINRVQDEFENDFDGSKPTDINSLFNSYLHGLRIDWESLFEVDNHVIHVNSKYFNLTDKPVPEAPSMFEEKVLTTSKRLSIPLSLKLRILFYKIWIPCKELVRPFIPIKVMKRLRNILR